MRAVLVEAPEAMLEERRRLGHDVFDEMWEGVLHMVPPAGGPHQRLGSFFLQALGPGVRRSGLVTPSRRGCISASRTTGCPTSPCTAPNTPATGASTALRSWSSSCAHLVTSRTRSSTETLIIHPGTRVVERYALRGTTYRLVEPDAEGVVTSEVLGVRLSTVETADGPACG